ncbi:hypothetical protein BH23VER1_BH23VER1_03720 [soil metagenome]
MDKLSTSLKQSRAGISLVEMLLAVAIVAIIAGGGYIAVSDLRVRAEERKLERDVLMLNAAVRTYRLSGGASLADVANVSGLLTRLKTAAASDTEDKVVGLRGTLVDLRLKAEELAAGVNVAAGRRAVWDAADERVKLVENSVAGVRKFYSDDTLDGVIVGATEQRRTGMEYALDDPWVWDYDDVDGGLNNAGMAITGGIGYGGPGGFPPGSPAKLVLNPPDFSKLGGDRYITEYDFTVVLTNPNPAGTSLIYYTVTEEDGVESPEAYYGGGPILVTPNDEIMGICRTIDPDHWEDSVQRREIYSTVPLDLQVELTYSQPSFTYAQLGGPLMPGNYDEFLATSPGLVTLLNLADIPNKYLTSSHFRIYWTRDGTDPLSSDTTIAGLDFNGVFPTHRIGLSLSDYGDQDFALGTAVGKSFSPELFGTSEPSAVTVGRTLTKLPPPIVLPAGGVTIGLNDGVTLAPDVHTGTVPIGARLLYTINGSDPGFASDGNLLPGTHLYGSGPVYPFDRGGFAVDVKSRLVGSISYLDWFIPSDTRLDTYYYTIDAAGTLWAIDTAGGGSLLEIRNYSSPQRGYVVDWGPIVFDDGTGTDPVPLSGLNDGAVGVAAMTITANGTAYFARNLPTPLGGGATVERALMALDIGSMVVGDTPVATLVGNLQPGLDHAVLDGAGGAIEGMAVSPEGKLFVTLERGTGLSDTLVRVDSLAPDVSGALTDVTLIGLLTGEAGGSTKSGDLAFAPDGTLYVSDRDDGEYYVVDAATGQVDSVFGKQGGTEYAALAFNHDGSGDFVASSIKGSGGNNTVVGIAPGTGTDTTYFSYAERGGYSEIEAMAFFTTDLTPRDPAPEGTIYAVAEGNRNIYKLDPATGTHTVLASDAPFDLNSLAHDVDKDILYFIENAEAEFRLGKYTIGSGEFEIIASLQTSSDPPFVDPGTGVITPSSYHYTPSKRPENLVFWCDSLWYIASGTDNLIRIQFRLDGSIKRQRKVADMGDDQILYNFGDVGDIAADSEGNLLFSDAYGTLYTYHIPSLSGLGIVASSFDPLSAIALDPGGSYFGVRTASEDNHRIYAIDGSSGVAAFASSTTPTLRFWDFAYGHAGSGNDEVVTASIEALGQYSIIVFDNYQTNTDIGGHALVGRDLKGSKAFNLGTDIAGLIPAAEPIIRVGGEVSGGNPITVHAGSFTIGKTRNNREIIMNSGGTVNENTPYDITGTRIQLEAASVGFAALEANGSVSVPSGQPGQLTFHSAAPPGGTAIFNIDGNTLFNNSSVKQMDIHMNGARSAIINVTGGPNLQWNHGDLVGYLGSNEATSTVLWNFPDVASFNLKEHLLKGALLAPFAYVAHDNSIDGSVVAKAAYSNGAVNRFLLDADLFIDPSGVPYTDFCLDDVYGPGLSLPPDETPKPGSYIGGIFQRADGTGRNIARLHNDGTLDTDFDPGEGASLSSSVLVIFEQDDKRLLIGGDFGSMSDAPLKAIVRMGPDGSVDPSFDAALQ